jgi:hypothetical protein
MFSLVAGASCVACYTVGAVPRLPLLCFYPNTASKAKLFVSSSMQLLSNWRKVFVKHGGRAFSFRRHIATPYPVRVLSAPTFWSWVDSRCLFNRKSSSCQISLLFSCHVSTGVCKITRELCYDNPLLEVARITSPKLTSTSPISRMYVKRIADVIAEDAQRVGSCVCYL